MFKSGKDCFRLGIKYRDGDGVRQDHAEAARWFDKGAQKGDIACLANLGWHIEHGLGAERDEETAAQIYETAAKSGDGFAMYALASCYERGVGVLQDVAQAMDWYRRSLAAGHTPARVALDRLQNDPVALIELAEDALEHDRTRNGITWMRRAAELGSADAQLRMAELCEEDFQGLTGGALEAARWLREAAANGSAEAQVQLGDKCLEGDGMPKNELEAEKWYRRAAEQGDTEGSLGLGRILFDREEYEAAFKPLSHAAFNGDTNATLYLAEMHRQGLGMPENLAEAERLYRDVAEFEDSEDAQMGLGLIASEREDFSEAARWFRKAADQGHAQAAYNLGSLYERGRGVAQNFAEAARWYRTAADSDDPDPDAQVNLGLLYERGTGVKRNFSEAAKYYRKAADLGHRNGETLLGHLYERGEGVDRDLTKAAKWYQLGVDHGSVEAQLRLAMLYAKGRGVQRNQERALDLLKQAAESGLVDAMKSLADWYEHGTGVGKDLSEALRLYELAAEQDEDDKETTAAISRIKKILEREQKGEQQSQKRAPMPERLAESSSAPKDRASPLHQTDIAAGPRRAAADTVQRAANAAQLAREQELRLKAEELRMMQEQLRIEKELAELRLQGGGPRGGQDAQAMANDGGHGSATSSPTVTVLPPPISARPLARSSPVIPALPPKNKAKDSGIAGISVKIPAVDKKDEGSLPVTVNKMRISRADVTYTEADRLGEGGFGTVYRGLLHDTTIVAIKTIKGIVDQRAIKLFLQEISIWGGLTQRNILPLLAYCDDPPMMVSEIASDGNMRDHMGRIEWDQVKGLDYLRGVADGMAFLHSFNVLHGDLKCMNVLIDHGIAKIADFGLSRIRSISAASTNSKTDSVSGTPSFMAPELFQGKKLQAPADVYAFAMVMFEVTSKGEFPLEHVHATVIHLVVLEGGRPERPDLATDEAWALMQRMWEQDPATRPSFREVRLELASWAWQ
ncbi:hypothetical protein DFJ74DRAFT_684590 [Hyaloraphidium curvatum]|nr:hypothetical protein DFJ74DRAFT_684590 [Hyaloraphidium curvatum]